LSFHLYEALPDTVQESSLPATKQVVLLIAIKIVRKQFSKGFFFFKKL